MALGVCSVKREPLSGQERSQTEGGIGFGLGVVLRDEVILEGGRVVPFGEADRCGRANSPISCSIAPPTRHSST